MKRGRRVISSRGNVHGRAVFHIVSPLHSRERLGHACLFRVHIWPRVTRMRGDVFFRVFGWIVKKIILGANIFYESNICFVLKNLFKFKYTYRHFLESTLYSNTFTHDLVHT